MSLDEKLFEIKRKWIPVYFILLIGLIILAIHFILMAYFTNNQDYASFSLLTLVAAGYIGYNLSKFLNTTISKYTTVKLLTCKKCGYSNEDKNVDKEDYVMKEDGICPKCGGKMIIEGIYRIEEKTKPSLLELFGLKKKNKK